MIVPVLIFVIHFCNFELIVVSDDIRSKFLAKQFFFFIHISFLGDSLRESAPCIRSCFKKSVVSDASTQLVHYPYRKVFAQSEGRAAQG